MMMENYTTLGFAYHQTRQYKKEKKLYRKAEKDFPDDPSSLYKCQAVLAFTERDTVEANRYIEKYQSALKDLNWSEAEIITNVASLYTEVSIHDKAEEGYRQALSLESNNPKRMNNLAYLLIDKDINLNEGLNLVETALKSEPDNYRFLHTKGWGLYKQGKTREALGMLQRSWDLKTVYDHKIYLHKEEVIKAISDQK
jgi:Tfp pilus assembly protein PilF